MQMMKSLQDMVWVDHEPGDPPIETDTDWNAVEALTDEQIHAAALADPDSQPIPPGTDEELAKQGLIHIPNVKKLRERLGLTQEAFAPARAYLTVIARNPEAVANLLRQAA